MSRKNATPSSGTSPLASYKEVPPSPPPRARLVMPRRCILRSSTILREKDGLAVSFLPLLRLLQDQHKEL